MQLFANRRVGVDIGATGVRVVEIGGVDSSGYAIVRRAARVPLREGAIVAGEIKNPALLGQILAQALKQAGVPRQGFVLGTTSRFAAVSHLDSPVAVAAHERTDQIRLSRHEVSPTVPLADSAISWNLVEVRKSAVPPTNVLNVALMLRRELEELRRVCKIASAQPQAIDLTAAGLLRALVRVPEDDRAITTIVDIGASKTLVATRQGTQLRSLRTIVSGGSIITRALMGSEDIDFDEAEDRKRFLRLPDHHAPLATGGYAEPEGSGLTPRSTAERTLTTAVDQLIEEIAKSISVDSQAHQRDLTRGIQLTGGGARIPGLPERLQARIGVPVVLTKPWAELALPKKVSILAPNEQPTELLGDLTAAIGLALWRTPQ